MADTPQAGATSSIEDQIRLREQKAELLREKGVQPYGNGIVVPHTTGFVRIRHADDDAAQLEEDQSEPYGIAGRVVALRTMGKATFLSLRDRTGREHHQFQWSSGHSGMRDVGELLCWDYESVRHRERRSNAGATERSDGRRGLLHRTGLQQRQRAAHEHHAG